MSYEVLARKWRPASFATMVGQEHVLRALIHALEADRLHHAYLFTGTRGVGKTTVARILARCLNCETGVTAEPCGTCSSCTEIAEGRFVDLIEVDAASRTKVEDTRELLENVQYAPIRGRYKVYLIDEVHMLSTASFNALLKTLEEPPPHVKFLLATTDPKKLPVTVLSRCLQFHLKNLTPERIVGHLEYVLGEEGVRFDAGALRAIARAADGSMRDALSLTDQAVAHGGGSLAAEEVALMLGTIDQDALQRILVALAAQDGPALLDCVRDLAEHAADFAQVLRDLMSALHQVAVVQAIPETTPAAQADALDRTVADAAKALQPEEVQLFYQIALTGIRDLAWAPDPRTGFEMTLLRMLAFQPEPSGGAAQPRNVGRNDAGGANAPRGRESSSGTPVADESAADAAAEPAPDSMARVADRGAETTAPGPDPVSSPEAAVDIVADAVADPAVEAGAAGAAGARPARGVHAAHDRAGQSGVLDSGPAYGDPGDDDRPAPDTGATRATAAAAAASARPSATVTALPGVAREVPETRRPAAEADVVAEPEVPARLEQADDWHEVLSRLALEGLTGELAAHCLPAAISPGMVELTLDPRAESLLADIHVTRLQTALGLLLGGSWRVRIEPGPPNGETPARRAERERDARQQHAERLIEDDPLVRTLVATFDATVVPGSIRPL